MFARRRPLARAAVVGGAAYYGGKKRAEGQAREQEQEARIAELEQLAQLKAQGILTDEEFEAKKKQILGI